MELHPLAQELNSTLERENPQLLSFLSQRGKRIFFPSKGILGQTAEAKGKTYNATIGIALDEDGTPLRLPSLAQHFDGDPRDTFTYAPSFGKKELRKKWQEVMREKNPSLKGATTLPVATSGLTHALDMAGYLFVDPGDRILLTDKYWGNYNLTFSERYGAELVPFNTFHGDGFDTAALAHALEREPDGKKTVLLNFPNNPAGYTPTTEEAQTITGILQQQAEAGDKLVVILDDAYFGLVYEEGIENESLLTKLADLHENILTVKIDGPTKEEYAWGLRVGFITFATKGMTEASANALEQKAAGAVRGSISNVCHHSQSALLQALSSPTHAEEKQRTYELMRGRYDEVRRVLSHPKYTQFFTPLPFNSGYFMCIQLQDNLDAEMIRKKLLAEYDTGIIATGSLLRIAYSSLPTAHIAQLFENIYEACASIADPQKTPITHSLPTSRSCQ
ncbi:aminotransferase class I/II-fold pyridoxal phosphate-dependent enzyme [Patescibacteria group bacterium]|nr:aminotransferase class I/II-fold pyridoxal phosphate-dependent enzyme [Patescibacteria group bacterium]